MSVTKMRARTCEVCLKQHIYAADECDSYRNTYGKICLSAPKDKMIVVSIGCESGRREFMDFCSWKCLKKYAVEKMRLAKINV